MSLYDCIACFNDAAAMYMTAPDLADSRASDHASAATNIVLPFFLGIKINASLIRRSDDPRT